MRADYQKLCSAELVLEETIGTSSEFWKFILKLDAEIEPDSIGDNEDTLQIPTVKD